MELALKAIDLVEKLAGTATQLRASYREYKENNRPPSLLQSYRTDQEINKENRRLLGKLLNAYKNYDGMALD